MLPKQISNFSELSEILAKKASIILPCTMDSAIETIARKDDPSHLYNIPSRFSGRSTPEKNETPVGRKRAKVTGNVDVQDVCNLLAKRMEERKVLDEQKTKYRKTRYYKNELTN
ncbi:hypothetical protein ILUMI_03691 [Ignelater luminosus]|uniref:Uncharacterized protein n=1 Tax=Ignelater luminosus TaxID=2038154 RepID=A0A8K0DFB1_IGNLU|nr:hypothetical protein ILUMI_03691 [Ignelater luminosus]